jgi:hypothetical protein
MRIKVKQTKESWVCRNPEKYLLGIIAELTKAVTLWCAVRIGFIVSNKGNIGCAEILGRTC